GGSPGLQAREKVRKDGSGFSPGNFGRPSGNTVSCQPRTFSPGRGGLQATRKKTHKKLKGALAPGISTRHQPLASRHAREFVQMLDVRKRCAVNALDLRVLRFDHVIFVRCVRAIPVSEPKVARRQT